MLKKWYEVRVRERIGEEDIKKSRFYLASTPKEAAARYKGIGHIMQVRKAPSERVLGIGSFFTMGTSILKELENEKPVIREREEERKREERRKSFELREKASQEF